jgi:hypothetical protein
MQRIEVITRPEKRRRDRLKIGGEAASATGGNESFAGRHFRP